MGKLTGKNRAKARKKEQFQKKKRYSAYMSSFINNIRKFDDPILKGEAEWCSNYDIDKIKKIAADMSRTLVFCKNGVGLAANQIGEPLAIIAIRPFLDGGVKVMIDPQITYYSEDKLKAVEGCLSYPGYYPLIERSLKIKVTYRDLDDKEHVDEEYKDFEARIIQHEVDHINGVCLVGAFYEKAKEDPSIIEKNEKEAIALHNGIKLNECDCGEDCSCAEDKCKENCCCNKDTVE